MAVNALNFGGLTIPPAAAVNAAAAPRTLAGAGARALVPLTYGEDRVSALILNVIKHGSDATLVLVQCLWGHACNAVDTFRLNDQALPGTATTTTYTGSQVAVDTTLAAAFTAQGITYSDTLNGYAYTVVSMKSADFDGQLNFSAKVQGRKLYDPRLDSTNGGSGSHRLATPSTWAYSTNPSLALADWLYSSLYGAGVSVLWSSVITAANANDALIGSPTETHRRIGVTFTAAVQAPDMAEALRAYAGVWLIPTSGGVKLLPDATAASVASYTHASGQIAAIDALTLRDLSSSPTAVEVVYTDTSQIPYRDASATAQRSGAGTTLPWRLSTVRLPGINRYGQALREATERLNKLYLSDLSTTLEVFDGGIAHEAGDVVTVTHPVGITSKLFRVSAVEMPGPGRWRLSLSEYDPAVYSTAVATAPTYSDAGRLISESDGIVWSAVTGRPSLFRVAARGFSATGYPADSGLTNGETGAAILSGGAMYRVAKINRSTGSVTDLGVFDTLGGGLTAANAMAAALNGITNAFIAVVFSYDEPQGNRRLGNLPAAMYRCGASRAVFGAPGDAQGEAGARFMFRSAYILIGIGGCGEGNGFEAYQGSADSDTNAWCDVAFSLQNGNLIVTGTGATPRTLADYSYVGALDATKGATWGGNITGQPADGALLNSYVGGNMYYPAGELVLPGGGGWLTETLAFRDGGVDLGAGFQPGETLTISAYMWHDAATATAGQYGQLVLVSAQAGGNWMVTAAIISSSTTPERKSATMTLPSLANVADMSHIGVYFYYQGTNYSTSPTGNIRAANIQVERGSVATQYAPRNVTGEVGTKQLANYAAAKVSVATGTDRTGITGSNYWSANASFYFPEAGTYEVTQSCKAVCGSYGGSHTAVINTNGGGGSGGGNYTIYGDSGDSVDLDYSGKTVLMMATCTIVVTNPVTINFGLSTGGSSICNYTNHTARITQVKR